MVNSKYKYYAKQRKLHKYMQVEHKSCVVSTTTVNTTAIVTSRLLVGTQELYKCCNRRKESLAEELMDATQGGASSRLTQNKSIVDYFCKAAEEDNCSTSICADWDSVEADMVCLKAYEQFLKQTAEEESRRAAKKRRIAVDTSKGDSKTASCSSTPNTNLTIK